MQQIPVLDLHSWLDRADRYRRDYHKNYLAMYSSIWQGIVTDPLLMTLPVDDHVINRGDGVFEAFKAVSGNIYNLEAHLKRLQRSASAVALNVPVSNEELTEIILQTIRVAGVSECLIRLFVSRGPGGFSTDPYETVGSQLYVVVSTLHGPSEAAYTRGVTAMTSSIPMKPSFFATVKSCNYLPNVMMKKEAIDRGRNYSVSFDENGYLGEGSTENMILVSEENELLSPTVERILRGTTMERTMELAQALVAGKQLKSVRFTTIPRDTVLKAREMMVVGTTINLLPVVQFDDLPLPAPQPGPIFKALSEMLRRDMHENRDVLTPIG